jgi:hypothetical protein
MNRLALPIAGLLVILAGCNQSSEHAATSRTANHPGQASAGGTPDQAVYDFLEAVRTGNDQKAAEMLSPLARQKTAEKQMVVAPPGSPTAKFTVGKVKYKPDDKDGAYVSCTWSDVDDQGQPRSDEIVWGVRNEPEGWRIVGMVLQLSPKEEDYLVLNFEDPDDMLRKQQMLHDREVGPTDPSAAGPQATRPDANPPAAR